MKRLVYFHWVPGQGSYHPFMNSYNYAVAKYRPVMRGIDATGPQKALDELGFQDFGLDPGQPELWRIEGRYAELFTGGHYFPYLDLSENSGADTTVEHIQERG